MTDKLYADRYAPALEPWFCRHMSAMTGEGLHDKSDIACELAFRDMEIERLRADAERYRWLRSRVWANDPNVFSLPVLVSTDDVNIMRGSVAQHFDDAIDSKRKVSNATSARGE